MRVCAQVFVTLQQQQAPFIHRHVPNHVMGMLLLGSMNSLSWLKAAMSHRAGTYNA